MAYSTQRDFFNVPFMNETAVAFECERACVKLKSYGSTIDDRSWALDAKKQSRFLYDLLTCKATTNDSLRTADVSGGSADVGGGSATGRFDSLHALSQNGIKPGDSLFECTNEHLTRLEQLFNLQKQLDVSNNCLKTAQKENEKIKSILNRKFDRTTSKDLYNKIQNLVSDGKICKNDEEELMQIYQRSEDMYKAYEILQAENSLLKRLSEKLAKRAKFEIIQVEPEKCTNVAYLQKQVNDLRREVCMLRQLEDDKLKEEQNSNENRCATDQDAELLKAIMKERNTLREKCKTFKELEMKVIELQNIAKSATNMSDSQSHGMDSQHICEMEQEMRKMQEYYEQKMQDIQLNEDNMKRQVEALKDDLMRTKCKAQKAECMQMEIGCLRNELKRADVKLSDSNCHNQQMRKLVAELQSKALQFMHDTGSQTCNDYMDDLTFFTSATLNEIMKELAKRDKVGLISGYTKKSDDGTDHFEKVHKQKLNKLTHKIGQLDCDFDKNIKKKATELGDGIKQALKLVKEISDIALQSQELCIIGHGVPLREEQAWIREADAKEDDKKLVEKYAKEKVGDADSETIDATEDIKHYKSDADKPELAHLRKEPAEANVLKDEINENADAAMVGPKKAKTNQNYLPFIEV